MHKSVPRTSKQKGSSTATEILESNRSWRERRKEQERSESKSGKTSRPVKVCLEKFRM